MNFEEALDFSIKKPRMVATPEQEKQCSPQSTTDHLSDHHHSHATLLLALQRETENHRPFDYSNGVESSSLLPSSTGSPPQSCTSNGRGISPTTSTQLQNHHKLLLSSTRTSLPAFFSALDSMAAAAAASGLSGAAHLSPTSAFDGLPSLLAVNSHAANLFGNHHSNPESPSDSATFFPTSSLTISALNRRRRNASVSSSNDSKSGEKKITNPVPDEKKDEAYWERRRKNNEAAKRSRDTRRAKEDEIAVRAAFLEQENIRLRAQLSVLKTETTRLHYMLFSQCQQQV